MATMQSNDNFVKEALIEKGSISVIKEDKMTYICRVAVALGNETRFVDMSSELVAEFINAKK